METLKESRRILLRHEIEVFTDHNNLTYETIESATQRIQLWKSLIHEFGVTLLYIKVEANVVADDFRRIPMAHHADKLADTTMEEDTCEILYLDSLLISNNTECFYLDIEDISFPLAPQSMEAEHKMDLHTESSTNIRNDPQKANSNWNYKPVEGINLLHYLDRISVPQTLQKLVQTCYHCYLQNSGGDRLPQKLATVCRWLIIIDQARKL